VDIAQQDLRLMQGLAQQVTALRPELISDDASVGELAWVWGKDHETLGESWRRCLWPDESADGSADGSALSAWAWAYLPYRVTRSDGGVVEVPHAYLSWQVHPGRPELLDEILDWFHAQAPGVDLHVPVQAADSDALERLAAHGFQPDLNNRNWIQVNERNLAGIEQPAVPDGFRFRTADETGPERAVRAHVDAWHPSTFTEVGFAGVRQAWPYRGDLHVLLEAPDGALVSTAIMWLDEQNRTAEFEPVGTHQGYRRRGLGRALLLHGMHLAREAGATQMTVACLGAPEHEAARGLYYSVGFRPFTHGVPHIKPAS
jgi:GNAT superfamily N-acetyltransferase